jgi:probable F420-dependent oxidoreductase
MPPQIPKGFAVSVPQLVLPDKQAQSPLPQLLMDIAHYADQVGYEALWTHEIMVGANLDPLATLAFLAASTTTIKLGVAVLLVPLRHPIPLAKDCASIDVLSSGRLVLGVGIGQAARRSLFSQLGAQFESRRQRLLESLDIMRQLWTEEEVTFRSSLFQLDSARVDLKPTQPGGPPIFFGGRAPQAIRRAGSIGAGWISGGTWPIAELAQGIDIAREAAANRADATKFVIARRIVIGVEDTRQKADTRMRAACSLHYRNADLAETIAVFGTAAECADRLHALRLMGVDQLILNPIYEEGRQLKRLTEEVIPTLPTGQ